MAPAMVLKLYILHNNFYEISTRFFIMLIELIRPYFTIWIIVKTKHNNGIHQKKNASDSLYVSRHDLVLGILTYLDAMFVSGDTQTVHFPLCKTFLKQIQFFSLSPFILANEKLYLNHISIIQ